METDIAALANGMVYKGDWNAGSGSFPGGGSAQTGWFYYVSGAGTVNGISFAVGDNIVATTDNASTSTYASNWSKHDQTDAVQSVVGLTGSIAKSSLLSALNVEDGADATDTANVTSAGALMDSEVDGDIKTFSLPANTTISAYGKTLVDDADAATARTTLGLGTAATTAASEYATAAQGTTANNALPKAGGAMTGAITTNSTFDGRDVATDGTKLDGIESGADQTDTANVTAAGALMDSEVDADIKTLSLPANTTISAFGKTLVDDADAATARTTLGLGTAATTAATAYATAAQGTKADAALPKAGGALTGAVTTNSTFDGRDVATDGTKLDGIETSADVTDTANVTSAGALMDSELTNLAAVKAINQSLVTSASPTFAALTANGNITVTGTVDGRDVAADGSKLDGIASGATNVTNNNQLTNGAGYTTNTGDITGVTAGTNLNGGGSSGGVTLNLDSTITVTTVNAGTVNTTSDERAKDDITPITGALDKVQQLGGYSFTLKATDEKSSGVIAQEVQKVMPELVQEGAEGLLSVQYGNMVGLLIEAIKEQQAQIDELKQKLNG